MTACMWARIDKVYYAATYEDVKVYGGFEDDDFMQELKKPLAERNPACVELLRTEAVDVWKQYRDMEDKIHY